MEEDLISIVIPVYNKEKYLRRCLNSVVNQTYKNLEIIVVDDGSTDSSYLIYESFQQKDDRFVIYKKENGGQGSARNLGIEKANGRYISFIDADDYVSPLFIELLYKSLKDSNSDISFCHVVSGSDFNYSFENEKYTGLRTYNSKNILENWFDMSFLDTTSPINKLYDVKLIKNNNIFFPNIHYFEDVTFSPMVVEKANQITEMQNILYYYLQNNDSTMHTFENNISKHEAFICESTKRMNWFKNNGYMKSYLSNAIKVLKASIYFYSKINNENFKNKTYENYKMVYIDVLKYKISFFNKLLFKFFFYFPCVFTLIYKLLDFLKINKIVFKGKF